jgi:hypothetical protein
MEALSVVLYIAAYLFAVVDGTLQDKGTYPDTPGRTGFRRYRREHPWILVGGLCGIAGTLISFLSD